MPKRRHGLYERLIEIGLDDPFIRGIVGVVVIAAAASFAISALGSGTKAVITLALCLSFGVVLVVLRALMKYADSPFVKFVCFAFSGVIIFVLLVFALLLIPAAVICWPQPYAALIGLPNCAAATTAERRFTPVPYAGTGITFNLDNDKYQVLVFYRPERQDDAERIVGALRSAGYRSDGAATSLDEVIAPNRQPDATLVRATTVTRPAIDDVSKVVKFAIPVKATSVYLLPDDASLKRGDLQVDLF